MLTDDATATERMGEGVCVLRVGPVVTDAMKDDVERLATDALVDGCREFVFDLTRVARYEAPALRALADLWRRLDTMACPVVVAARNPGAVDCLHRVVPARGKWTLRPTTRDALEWLLAQPV